MPSKEEPTFYSYVQGRHPDELRLGHIVFGSYRAPTQEPRSPPIDTCVQLISCRNDSEIESDEYTISLPMTDVCFSTGRLRGLDVGVTAVEFVHAGLSWERSEKQIIVAKRCRRVTIVEPKTFLNRMILKSTDPSSENEARKTLERWLSLSKADILTKSVKRYVIRTPRIWMLTGLYELEDATSVRTTATSFSPTIGVGAEIMASLGIPVGFDISPNSSQEILSKMTFPGKTVWAAQYQMLDLKYWKAKRDEIKPALTLPVEFRTTMAAGNLLAEDREIDNAVTIGVADADEVESNGEAADAYNKDFWQYMQLAEKRWGK
ncbi:hypothetical protein K431DRAFT_274846 [Polychaeton citri CBS 116435]|uniref:Uncharacterized protein n=1 Tax=Polychaeton citri CBS 116435 TaxID=1314669 RepID=A0A9P4Q271_9PEZI|nr:hypothetical protein K431DRAFT_274846 [Polychaeton citri CBS 116435]